MSDRADDLARFKTVRHESCPDAETLLAYEQLAEQQRPGHAAFVHIELCMHCQSVLEALRSDRPETVEEDRAWTSVQPVLDRAVLARLPRRRTMADYRVWAAAAAVFVLAVGLYIWREPSGEPDPGVRGSEVQLLGPAGSVTLPLEFRWSSPVVASSFRVELLEGDQTLASRTSTQQHLPSSEFGSLLQSRRDYRWRVTALDENGETIVASAVGRFHVSAP